MDGSLSEEEKKKKALEILDRFGIKELAENHPMALSGGQKQRVAIASSVAAGRDIILMDEPTSGMDELNMKRLSQELKLDNINRYPKIIDELYGGKITVVQLVLTIPNPIDFVRNYDKIGI